MMESEGKLYYRSAKEPEEWLEGNWHTPPYGFEMKEEGGTKLFRPRIVLREGPPPGWTLDEVESEIRKQDEYDAEYGEPY